MNRGLKIIISALFIGGVNAWLMGGSPPVLTVIQYLKTDTVFLGDNPSFIAYENGMIIWRKNWANGIPEYRMAQGIDVSELSAGIFEVAKQPSRRTYRVTSMMDPQTTVIWARGATVKVEGNWREPFIEDPSGRMYPDVVEARNAREKSAWETLPKSLLAGLRRLEGFSSSHSEAWRPDQLVLVFIPVNTDAKSLIGWPADWPTPERMPKEGSFELSTLSAPGRLLESLLRLCSVSGGQPRPVSVKGRAYLVKIGYVFPEEKEWASELKSLSASEAEP